MFKSILARYYIATIVTITSCFVIVGITLVILTAQYTIEQKEKTLYQNAVDLSEMVKPILSEPFDRPKDQESVNDSSINLIRSIVKVISEGGSKDVILVNTPKNDCICINMDSVQYKPSYVDDSVLDALAASGGMYDNGTLSGTYDENKYTAGLAVRDENGVLLGYIFISTPASSVTRSLSTILKYFLFAVLGVFMLSLMLVKVASRELVQPMREMRLALIEYGQGNFSKRIHVSGSNEISELCKSFNQMADSLDQLEHSRRGFMANISHDLKTPLTTIGGFIDGMLDDTIPAERQKEYLKRISDETKRLNRLVNSILDVTRLEAGQTNPKKVCFNIDESITRVLLSFEKVIEDKKINLDFDFGNEIDVYADEDMISRVLVNIIGNATKFTPDGGLLRVTSEKVGKNAVIKIANEGKGISADDLPFIFDRFYKADKSRGLDKKGTGLGLYIAKMLVQLNNGEISVTSQVDGITEFTFVLECAEESNKPTAHQRKSLTEKGE